MEPQQANTLEQDIIRELPVPKGCFSNLPSLDLSPVLQIKGWLWLLDMRKWPHHVLPSFTIPTTPLPLWCHELVHAPLTKSGTKRKPTFLSFSASVESMKISSAFQMSSRAIPIVTVLATISFVAGMIFLTWWSNDKPLSKFSGSFSWLREQIFTVQHGIEGSSSVLHQLVGLRNPSCPLTLDAHAQGSLAGLSTFASVPSS